MELLIYLPCDVILADACPLLLEYPSKCLKTFHKNADKAMTMFHAQSFSYINIELIMTISYV